MSTPSLYLLQINLSEGKNQEKNKMPPQKHPFIQQIEEIHYTISIENWTFTQQNDDTLNLPINSDGEDDCNRLTIASPTSISQCNPSVTL